MLERRQIVPKTSLCRNAEFSAAKLETGIDGWRPEEPGVCATWSDYVSHTGHINRGDKKQNA